MERLGGAAVRGFKRMLVILLVLLVGTSAFAGAADVLAADLAGPQVTVIQNDYIKVTVDNATGRYGVRTVEGQPIRKKDQNVDMLFRGDDPETSFTTFRIDGVDYIFGNPYKFGVDLFSEITQPRIVLNPNGTKQIETVWKIKGVAIKQILMLYSNSRELKNAGNVNIRYEVQNNSGVDVQLGTRILLDTMVAGNDGPEFQIGTTYKVPLTVERKLVHEPNVSAEDMAFWKLPPYWVMRDKLDLTNPQATNVMAYGFNNFAESNINLVEEMIVGHWNGLANTKWDYTPNGNLDFTRDTNDFGTADSAVAFYWTPKTLHNQASQSFETVYGLGEIIEPDKVFSLRYLDTPQQLEVKPDNSGYNSDGMFDIIAEIENLAMFNMEHSKIEVQMTLESGLSFVKLDAEGNVVYKNGKPDTETTTSKLIEFRKAATPQEAQQGIEPTFKPGDTIAATFKVMAKGKPWPTTKDYMITAKSPETERKLEGLQDEGVKAQYESSKTSFIMLPAVGQAQASYIYGMAPKELYASDVKYITANITNIDAYNTGGAAADPNFDLYLMEKVTGKRYKLDLKNSVLLQPADDGFSGDMKITYRGGDQVDNAGRVVAAGLGPELPMGDYIVQVDYKGDAGGDAELAALFDLTSTQSFKVTDNQQTRIREANIMAVYKQKVDLSDISLSVSSARVDEINKFYPSSTIKTVSELNSAYQAYKSMKDKIELFSTDKDPKLDFAFFKNQALSETPSYTYKLFDSEAQMNEFFDASHRDREKLVVIRGMIKQVGTGADMQVVVDTKTEPAIINDAVAYRGKDLVFVRGKLDAFGVKSVPGYNKSPFFDSLFVKGEGKLSIANSGFTFYSGEWTLDFYNGFEKKMSQGFKIDDDIFALAKDNEEDKSLNGTINWALGNIGDRINPLRQLMIEDIYFNRHSLFATPSFSVNGFALSFNDFILRPGGISFGGKLALKIVTAEARNIIFNNKGFVGIDADLKFNLDGGLGLLNKPSDNEGTGGEIYITHYVQKVENVSNRYGIKFHADVQDVIEVQAELAFKQVDDGRILPDVIAFGTSLPKPGVLMFAATYLTGVRGGIRELADTIAGGSKKDPFPLVLQAGADIRFGISPVNFYGSIDLTLKRTGFKLEGTLGYSPKTDADKDELIEMLTYAMLEAQWVTPWFIMAEAEVDPFGWGVIIGKAGIFVGQNLEKHRIDFEGFISAKLQIPNKVPIVGGMPLASVSLGVNNDKIWGSFGILLIKVGLTYYWGGGIEFGTSGEGLPEGLIHLLVDDPEHGQRLLVIGSGATILATSLVESEQETHEIVYHEVEKGMSVIENGAMGIGMGGITVKNAGRVHEIPMSGVTGNAVVELEYTDADMPSFTLKDASGAAYPIIFDNTNTNPNANAFTQHILAAKNDQPNVTKDEEVDRRRAYVIIPKAKLQAGGTWTLTSVSPVETRLLNLPTLPQLQETTLTPSATDANKFTAAWKVDNAQSGDKINLYLTKDALGSSGMATLANGAQVPEPGDPGILIAKDVELANLGGVNGSTTTGSKLIDVSQVSLLGDLEDVRGLLQSGDYYLRAELQSSANYDTKTSLNKFTLIDPLAPAAVSDVKIEPAGNGYFNLSFLPAAEKPGQEDYERSFRIEAFQEQIAKLGEYAKFPELLFTETELAPYLNGQSKRYEGIPIGGWTQTSTADTIQHTSLNASAPTPAEQEALGIKYVGLEVGQEYIIGVSSATKPGVAADKNDNYHFAATSYSAKKLLPVPVKPRLREANGNYGPYINYLTNKTEQTITFYSQQQNLNVEAFLDGQSLGQVTFTNDAQGSHGTLSFNQFPTDGVYGIELVATNQVTKDIDTNMLYLTVDTRAPVLYLTEPLTGSRTENGKIRVAGTTSNDAVQRNEGNVNVAAIQVNGQLIPVADDGSFSGLVNVNSQDPNAELTITAQDGAGNSNSAKVVVTNDSFAVPVGLVLKKVASPNGQELSRDAKLLPAQAMYLKPYLLVPDGKDGQNKPKFKEVAVPDADLARMHYSVVMGEAVELNAAGKVTGTAVGTSLLQGEYVISEGVSVQAMTFAAVEVPAPTQLQSIPVTASSNGTGTSTRLNVAGAGDLTGYQLVYKVFPNDTDITLPSFKEVLTDWNYLPPSGDVVAASGSKIVLAKRTSLRKETMAVSAPIIPVLYSTGGSGGSGGSGGTPGGGFGGGGGPGGAPTINGLPLVATRDNNDILNARITTKDITDTGGKDISITIGDVTLKGLNFKIDKAVSDQAVAKDKTITLQLPMGSLILTPKMLSGLNQDLEIKITPNGDSTMKAMREIADSVDSALLAGGQGVAIETNIAESSWTSYASSKIKVPDGMKPEDITAVVLRNPDGSWTTVPWKLDASGKVPYVDVRLTGNGSISFLSSTKSFSDVEDGFWAASSIKQAASKLFVQGKEATMFEPDSAITRAEYPTLLLRVAGLMNKNADASFTDVSNNDWFDRSVSIAAKLGIVNGLEDGSYAPQATLTRVEAMTMVGRLLTTLGMGMELSDSEVDGILGTFEDRELIPDWARKPVALSIKNNIIQGDGSKVNPQDALTRAQAAAIAVRLDQWLIQP